MTGFGSARGRGRGRRARRRAPGHARLPRGAKTGRAGGDLQRGSYLGPKYSSQEVCAFLDRHAYPYRCVVDADERSDLVAEALANGKIVGLLSGRMEFGPRALGARSILGDPRAIDTQIVMNQKIKRRNRFDRLPLRC